MRKEIINLSTRKIKIGRHERAGRIREFLNQLNGVGGSYTFKGSNEYGKKRILKQ